MTIGSIGGWGGCSAGGTEDSFCCAKLPESGSLPALGENACAKSDLAGAESDLAGAESDVAGAEFDSADGDPVEETPSDNGVGGSVGMSGRADITSRISNFQCQLVFHLLYLLRLSIVKDSICLVCLLCDPPPQVPIRL